MNNPGIIPIWQPIGFSTHQISKNVGKLFNTRATHTGTLDPLAQGVIVVLTGDERYNKDKHTNWHKTYDFEIAFGVSTDSFDAMGYINDVSYPYDFPGPEKISIIIEDLVGDYIQEVPIYSAIRHKGKRLFEWAHLDHHISKMPKKSGEIYNARHLHTSYVDFKELIINKILPNLENIVGDFRQEEIIIQWRKFIEDDLNDENVPVTRIIVEVSRGIYIRSLSQDICRKIGVPGFVSSLTRVRNGPYQKEDCKSLEDLFGQNFDRQKFVSAFKPDEINKYMS